MRSRDVAHTPTEINRGSVLDDFDTSLTKGAHRSQVGGASEQTHGSDGRNSLTVLKEVDEDARRAPCSSRIPVDPVPNLANESLFSTMHTPANGSVRSLVFIMQPGTTATLCISYQANETLTADGLLADAVSVNASSIADGAQHSYSVAPNVTFKLL